MSNHRRLWVFFLKNTIHIKEQHVYEKRVSHNNMHLQFHCCGRNFRAPVCIATYTVYPWKNIQKLWQCWFLGGRMRVALHFLRFTWPVYCNVNRQEPLFPLPSKHVECLGCYSSFLSLLTSNLQMKKLAYLFRLRPPDATLPVCRALQQLNSVKISTVPLMG